MTENMGAAPGSGSRRGAKSTPQRRRLLRGRTKRRPAAPGRRRRRCGRRDFGRAAGHSRPMHTILIVLLALIGVLTVLGLGMATLARGGNPQRSNKLMQARVMFQALALVLLAILMM